LENAGDDAALVPNDLRTIALTRVFGFEIMPAPFVIAHLQIASLLETAGAPLPDDRRAGVYLTNALTGWVPEQHPQSSIFEEFRHEREDSEQIKQQDPILIILGNPPYNGYAGIAKIDEERDLTNDYREPVEGLPVPQGQGLNDLYIRFFRIAERRITTNADGKGIVSFISNYSWLDGLSHPTMRHNYLNAFDDIYVDNLHGDRKISEYAPDGRTSETIFAVTGTSVGIRIGTAISTLVRKSKSANKSAAVHYRDFQDARAATRRQSLLASLGTNQPTYSSLVLSRAMGLPFKPRTFETAYLVWPRLPELFPISSPGIKTSRDSLLVDIDRTRLESRMEQYLGTDSTDAEMAESVPCAMQSSARFDPIDTRRTLQEKGFRPWQILRYAYRPFDLRWLYWEPETKLLDEKRSEYIKQTIFPSPCLATQQKCRGEWSAPQLISQAGCLDLLDRGASCFPVTVIDVVGTLLSEVRVSPNLSTSAVAKVNEIDGNTEDLFFHALAIMHSPQYRTENVGALLADWPRVPMPGAADLLSRSAIMGRRLADLLDAESHINLSGEWSFLAALKLPPNPVLENALKITSGWGRRGRDSTVMPGSGLCPSRHWTDTELEKIALLAATQSLPLEDALDVFGETCVEVHLNGESFWSAVPINVWKYMLGGYQVLKKWLSYRELPLLGRPLHSEEAAYFAQVVRRIAAIILFGSALDTNYRDILPTATGLPAR
jgi:predicted helicase